MGKRSISEGSVLKLKIEDYIGQRLEDSVKDTVGTRTYERYESFSRVHIVPELGHKTLTSLTEMDVQSLQSLYRRKLDSGCSGIIPPQPRVMC